jgi:hypothetical protein
MATYTKHILSGSTGGAPILVTGTAATAGTVVHAGPTATTTIDEVWLWANNVATDDREIFVQLGGVATDFTKQVGPLTLTAREGPKLIIPGIPLTGNATSYAVATATSSVTLIGYVNRITTAT